MMVDVYKGRNGRSEQGQYFMVGNYKEGLETWPLIFCEFEHTTYDLSIVCVSVSVCVCARASCKWCFTFLDWCPLVGQRIRVWVLTAKNVVCWAVPRVCVCVYVYVHVCTHGGLNSSRNSLLWWMQLLANDVGDIQIDYVWMIAHTL